MPYVTQQRKEELATAFVPDSPGDLNYIFTEVINEYIQDNGLTYSIINEVVGALECCKMELYRRVAVPYEDTKIKTNGDVYDDSLLG